MELTDVYKFLTVADWRRAYEKLQAKAETYQATSVNLGRRLEEASANADVLHAENVALENKVQELQWDADAYHDIAGALGEYDCYGWTDRLTTALKLAGIDAPRV